MDCFYNSELAWNIKLLKFHQLLYFSLLCNFLKFWNFKQIFFELKISKNNLIITKLERYYGIIYPSSTNILEHGWIILNEMCPNSLWFKHAKLLINGVAIAWGLQCNYKSYIMPMDLQLFEKLCHAIFLQLFSLYTILWRVMDP